MALSKVQSNSIADSAITSTKISDGAVTASDLHTTAITDKLGFTPVNNLTSGSFGVATGSLYSQIPNSLQVKRIAKIHTWNGGMNGSTWVNTGITLEYTLSSYSGATCAIIDAFGIENNRNQCYRRFIVLKNNFDGTSVWNPIGYSQGGSYGQMDLQLSGTQIQIKASNGVSGGNVYLSVQELVVGS
jgi:hypothetical protein